MTTQLEQVPGFLGFDHLAFTVPPGQLDTQIAVYALTGCREVRREEVHGTDQVREVMLQVGGGDDRIQLLEPLSPQSPVAKQLERNGGRGGFAHLAFRVQDIHLAFDHMKAAGFRIIDEHPRPGARGTTVFFVHPKTTPDAEFGYLIEVVQEDESEHG